MKTKTGWLKRLFGEKETQTCLACGECCKAFSWHLKVSPRDIERWRDLGREDIIAHVNLKRGWIWYDPETRDPLPLCPYLVQTAPDKAHCGIHEIKPDVCTDYPKLTHGGRCWRGLVLGLLLPLAATPIPRKLIRFTKQAICYDRGLSDLGNLFNGMI